MDFDLKKEYQRYTNAELMRIVLHPDQYQPQAVAIANELLQARGLTDEEQTLAAESILPGQRRQTVAGWKPGDDLFLNDSEVPLSTVRKYRILAVALGGYILYYFANLFKALMQVVQVPELEVPGWIQVNVFLLLASIGVFVLFLCKMRAGWIITLISIGYFFAKGACFLLFMGSSLPLTNILFLLCLLAFYIAWALLLNQPQIRKLYAIDERLFKITLAIGVLVCAIPVVAYLLPIGQS